MKVYCLLLFVYSVASVSDQEKEQEERRNKVLEQLSKNRTVLVDGYHLVTRQTIVDVHIYRNYRSVSVVRFSIVRDISDARFTFQSEELHLNSIGSCQPRDVIVNIKRASFPAVNPDNFDFPKGFISSSFREPTHTIEIASNGNTKHYSIKNPRPGNWYALIYVKWEDPREDKVEQQGLTADCSTFFYTDLQVKTEDTIELIDCYVGITIDNADIPADFKCITIDSIEPISFNLTVTNTTNSDNVLFRVQLSSLPTEEDYLVTCAFDPKLGNVQTITFTPGPNQWHYIRLEHTKNSSNYADCESYFYRTDFEEAESNHTIIDLMRDDKRQFFTYEYGLPTTDIQDATSLINLTSNDIKSLRFKVNEFIDIGGNLAIEVSLIMSLKYYMGYRRQIKKGALLAFTEDNQFFKAVICMDISHPSIPLPSGHCQFNDKLTPALFILNSTDSESIYGKVIIPYPDSGTWYLTTRLFCDGVVCPCRTSHNGTKYYVDTEGSDKEEGENISGEFSNYTREGKKDCNASLVMSISSTSCLGGTCGNQGDCLLNTFGGLVVSYCSCTAGYGAWDCSDDSRMDSRAYMLLSVLFLTLSNLLFLFTIYIAIVRLYYTEAMLYTFTMVFSTFYHACDAPVQVAYCIVRGKMLQFGDFYCGIMCFWVTLLAMSIMADKLRSTLQLAGAIVIALLTTWNMHSIISFMVPVIVGVVLLLLSWLWDYKRVRRFRYPKSYYIKHLPIGLVLVSVGLIAYAFLQTEKNYKVVHSLWHGLIAISVLFLLPDVKREGNKNPFLPSTSNKLKFLRIFKRSQAALPTRTDNQVRVD